MTNDKRFSHYHGHGPMVELSTELVAHLRSGRAFHYAIFQINDYFDWHEVPAEEAEFYDKAHDEMLPYVRAVGSMTIDGTLIESVAIAGLGVDFEGDCFEASLLGTDRNGRLHQVSVVWSYASSMFEIEVVAVSRGKAV